MWRAGLDVKATANSGDDDDWETDPDFVVSIYGWFVLHLHDIESFKGI